MNVSIGDHLTSFVESIVKSGRYASACEVVRDGLRLVEEREAKLNALRDTINGSIEAGGHNTDEDVTRALDALDAKLAQDGY
jgi:antitoxin ParD1/3/4